LFVHEAPAKNDISGIFTKKQLISYEIRKSSFFPKKNHVTVLFNFDI